MDRERERERSGSSETLLPRGLTRRRNAGNDVIQIAFTFRGQECRESLRLDPDKKADVRTALVLREEILRRIGLNTFNYVDYFPNSPRASKFGFGSAKKVMRDLFGTALASYEKAKALGNMSPSTVQGYSKIIRGDLLPYFGDYALRDVTPALVREWMGTMNCTAKTSRNRTSLLRSVLDDAVEDGLIDQNPLDRIALKKVIARTAKKSDYEVDPFDQIERDAILLAAEKRDPQAKNLFQFAFWSGLRTSELIALEWADVDWIHGAVRVHHAVVAKQHKSTTKTKAGTRDVHLLPAARSALEAQKSQTFLAGGRVFHNPAAGTPWETDKQIRVLWTYVLKVAGVRYRNPYQTRHTYACTMLSRGEGELWVAQQLGHKGVEMVRRHYGKRWIPVKDSLCPTVNDWSKIA
jgi:integrase